MNTKFLSIGSVVLLKNAKKRIMIIGFSCTDQSKPEKTYDYCGVVYPEGYLIPNQLLLFDHSQIEKVFYLGLDDSENKEFQNELLKHING